MGGARQLDEGSGGQLRRESGVEEGQLRDWVVQA